MTQQAFLPSPKTTLVVILGTSDYPYAPDIESVTEFANSARDFKQYVLNTFGIPKENVHDLFNSPLSPADMETNIAEFFKQRTAKLAWDGITVRDALIYFVGHGSFTEGNQYSLLVRYTRIPGPPSSRLLMGSLASTIKESTRHIRRILVLDCCFAGAAVQYQSPDAEFVIRQTIGAFAVLDRGQGFPTKGTTLLCSSSKDRASIIMQASRYTAFSDALLYVLRTGDAYLAENLSLRTVTRLVEDYLYKHYHDQVPRPELHSPDQSQGDIAELPFFPNPARRDDTATRVSFQLRHIPYVSAPLEANRTTQVLGQSPSLSGRAIILRTSVAFFLVIIGSLGLLLLELSGKGHEGHQTTTTSTPKLTSTLPTSPNPYPPPYGGKLIFDDPLINNSQGHNWYEQSNSYSSCQFIKGAYHAVVLKAHLSHHCLVGANMSNVAFEVQMTIIKGYCAGMVLRAEQQHNYVFEVCQDNKYYGFYRYDDSGSALILASGLFPELKQSNIIAVVANKSTFNMYINGDKVNSTSDSAFSSGLLGVEVDNHGEDNNDSEAVFTNARLWNLDVGSS